MDDNERVTIARRVCGMYGVELVDYAESSGVPLAVIGLGAGITMAVADHLRNCYPAWPLVASDLPGGIGFQSRVTVLDYVGTAMPALFLMWSSIKPGTDYPFALDRLSFKPPALWVYAGGLNVEETRVAWWSRGANVIDDLWTDDPLGVKALRIASPAGILSAARSGNLKPNPTSQTAGLDASQSGT